MKITKSSLVSSFIVIALLSLGMSSCASQKSDKTNNQAQHLVEQKGLCGMWNQAAIYYEGQFIPIESGNYKVINPDGTFYTFVTYGDGVNGAGTRIVLYGTYSIKDSYTYTEYIKKHGSAAKMSGTKSDLHYKLLEDDMLQVEFFNEALGKWVPELWKRVPLIDSKPVE